MENEEAKAEIEGQPGEGEEPQVIQVGDKEYSPEDLEDLVGRGSRAKEIEEKFSTDLDKVYPEFTRKSQILADPEKLAEYYKGKYGKDLVPPKAEEISGGQGEGVPTGEELEKALAYAESIGILTKRSAEKLFGQLVDSRFDQKFAGRELMDNCLRLEKDINGSDGRPTFKAPDVLEFMKEEGVNDPEKAYKLMHEEALDEWKSKQLAKKPKAPVIERGGAPGGKVPKPVKPTPEDLGKHMEEALEESASART